MSVRGILTMALATVAMACGQQSRSNVRQVGGNLYAEPSAVDFGDVALGKEQSTSVLLRNDGILKMTVDSLPGLPGESAFVVTGLPVELAPGQVARVEVKYQPGDTGSHARKVELVTDAPGAPQSNLELRGHAVRGLARLSGDVIDFGDVVLNEGAIQMLSLNNNDGHAATSVVIAHPEGANAASFAVGRVGTLPLGPEESLSVRLDFSPDHLGEYTALLQVTPCPTCAARRPDAGKPPGWRVGRGG